MSSQIRQGRFNVLLTTYEYVIKDKATLAKVSLEGVCMGGGGGGGVEGRRREGGWRGGGGRGVEGRRREGGEGGGGEEEGEQLKAHLVRVKYILSYLNLC